MLATSYNTSLTNKEFDRLSQFIYSECGIKMPPAKKVMLEARLRKRLRELNLDTFADYCDLIFNSSASSDELIHMIDVVTTNKTEFFREPKQFSYMTDIAVPEMISQYGAGVKRKLRLWSAGCSTGEEPYTLAMVLQRLSESIPDFDYSILASDISTQVLEKALIGIYPMDRLDGMPIELKKKFFLKSKDKTKSLVRVVPELRQKVSFQRINFMDDDYSIRERQDMIYCRNVIIYFDKKTQEQFISKLCNYLIPGGYLFLGHSETLFNMDLPLVQIATSTYKRI
ncbi:MAG: CheR family methyltransferase [Bacteroidota bacterium]